jgi:2'-5' RNA ligase
MERLFLAVPLTEEARREVEAGLEPIARDLPGRSVKPENWHLTLRFLGDTAPEQRDRLVRELEGTCLGPAFSLEFGGLGAFPRAERARVLWLGVEQGATELTKLARSVESAAHRAGFAAETKPFRAHLTLNRIQPPRSVAALPAGRPRLAVQMQVHEVVLFRSHLGRGPTRYEDLARFPLATETG